MKTILVDRKGFTKTEYRSDGGPVLRIVVPRTPVLAKLDEEDMKKTVTLDEYVFYHERNFLDETGEVVALYREEAHE